MRALDLVRFSATDRTVLKIQNFNDNRSLQISRVDIFDADAAHIGQFPSPDPLPAGFRQTLRPQEATTFDTADVAVFGAVPQANPLQIVIQWHVKGALPGFPLIIQSERIANAGYDIAECEIFEIGLPPLP